MIIADNVVRKGAVSDAGSRDTLVQGVRRFNELLAAEKRVSATVIQTVGSKGYDGFAIAFVNPPISNPLPPPPTHRRPHERLSQEPVPDTIEKITSARAY